MKKKDRNSYHAMTQDELKKQEEATRAKRIDYLLGKDSKQQKNVRIVKMFREKIAVLSTIAHEKELAHETQ